MIETMYKQHRHSPGSYDRFQPKLSSDCLVTVCPCSFTLCALSVRLIARLGKVRSLFQGIFVWLCAIDKDDHSLGSCEGCVYGPPGQMVYFNVLFRLCGHLFPISVLLFMMLAWCKFFMMWNFSDRHRSHDLLPASYVSHFCRNFQDMLGLGLSPWSQT